MNELRNIRGQILVALLLAVLGGCASSTPPLSYPAFVQINDRPDSFVAGFPGLRPKSLSMDSRTGKAGYRLLVPSGWKWNTGAAPGMTVEIFVLRGELRLADLSLQSGGYAYLPSGSLGFAMHSPNGAELLYFLDAPDEASVIRTPLITNSDLVDWKPVEGSPGLSSGELRLDPGSGSRTWLLRVDPQAKVPWQAASFSLEGYLVAGDNRHSECVAGKAVDGEYSAGGYFFRPAGMVSGSEGVASVNGAIWFLRRLHHGEVSLGMSCGKIR